MRKTLIKYVPTKPVTKYASLRNGDISVFLKKTEIISTYKSKLCTPEQAQPIPALAMAFPFRIVKNGKYESIEGKYTGNVKVIAYPRRSRMAAAVAAVGSANACKGLKTPNG